MQAYPESNFPSAYRILDVTPADIIAVHDLHDWPNEEDRDSSWRPDPSRVAKKGIAYSSRMKPQPSPPTIDPVVIAYANWRAS